MFTLDRILWMTLSPQLDRALGMSGNDRAAYLRSVSEEDPVLADQLRSLLDEHRDLVAEGFLEGGTGADAGPPALVGQTLGAYTLRSLIGEGGMGTVWLAERTDGRFERRAAIKLLSIALVGRGEERFKREGSMLARLEHPHIAQLTDAGVSAAGQPFLVLEHVEGEPIDQYCDHRALDVNGRLRLFLDVLSAVAHAHAHLIVHRDVKPSNVFVTLDGRVKLLDFGIAKLLEDDEYPVAATMLTRETGGALTPAYAAPEQITGGPISTATDVYALGVLLYVLLTGRHPAGTSLRSAGDLIKAIVDNEPRRPSDAVTQSRTDDESAATHATRRASSPDKLRRLLRGDLDTIVLTALKKHPPERYASVPALADDLRRYLRHEPISARPVTIAYRSAKFVRRNWLSVAAVAVTVAGLSTGLYVANRERAVATRRFIQVRQLANKLFDIDVQVRALPGSSKARQLIVDTSLEYLRRLTEDVQGDPDLALDVGTAYMRVARVQGVPISANLGQMDQAEQNLRTADALIVSVLAAQPGHRTAFFRRAQIAHDRMILAGLRRPNDEALPLARQSAQWLDKYLDTGDVEISEAAQVMIALNNVGNRFRIARQFDEALRLTSRGVEVARHLDDPSVQRQLGGLLIATARIHRDRGALEESFDDLREAARTLEPPAGVTDQGRTLAFTLALTEAGQILGEGVSLGRPDEAVVFLKRALRIVDEIVHQDQNDAQSRERLSTTGRSLAQLLCRSDDQEAVAVYDHVLRHLAEIKDNAKFRRDEVRALAGSASPLQRLGNAVEARRRLDAAFDRLSQLKLYPADTIDLGSEADDALRALADYEAAMGNTERANGIGRTLLGRILAAKPNPEDNLADAAQISQLYASLAVLHRRAGSLDHASELDMRRDQLWQHWERKLPNNPFVVRQSAAMRRDQRQLH
jgi:serine/threonine protein kinase/tetratricopeptide (TPR) repeat protein